MDQAIESGLQYLGILNAGTLILVFIDKFCAVKQLPRIGGWVFLTASTIGGSLGAKIGQKLFLHKVLDTDYTVTLNLIIILQCVALFCAWVFFAVDVDMVQEFLGVAGGAEDAGPRRFGPGADD